MSTWQTAKAPDGRTYYYKGTETRWEKPDDFVEPAGEWKEATNADGRVYYWNTVTKATQWEKPEGFVASTPTALVAGGGRPYGGDVPDRRMARRDDRDHGLPQKPSFDGGRGGGMPWEGRQDHGGFRGPAPLKTDEPEYATTEQAEEAFFNLLRKHKISPSTQWEDALRAVIKERDYRAFKDPKQRRDAFEKYCIEVRAQEKSKEKERREKQRADFLKMLSTHEDIQHYTRWKTARPKIEREVAFRNADDEDERRQLFDEYIVKLKKEHAEAEAQQRESAQRQIYSFLENEVKDADAKWDDVAPKLLEFPGVSKLAAITAFETHMRALERDLNASKQYEKRTQMRAQRQARDDFKSLLRELHSKGTIKHDTRWSHIFPIIAEDPRFLNVVGNPGSSPLEMFWDLVEKEDQELRIKREYALDVLELRRFEVTLNTTLDEFAHVMQSDPRTASFSSESVSAVFERIRNHIKRRKEERRDVDDRVQNRAVDDLRRAMKKIEPPIRLSDSYEDVIPALTSLPEYQALDEAGRRYAFDKYMSRLRKEEESHDRDRHRDSHRSDRDRDRDRDRHHRERTTSRRDRDRRHRTRTPEVDVYEAERRKAQENRERNYRKASFSLDSRDDRRRDDDRDRRRDDDRGHRSRHERGDSGGVSVYEQERRQRELERERNYVSRADPRDRARALDYGDDVDVGAGGGSSRAGSVRKRGESVGSAGEGRGSKRPRRNGKTPEPQDAKMDDDEPGLRSGSEEGEIEEV